MEPQFEKELKKDLKVREKVNAEIKDVLAIERTSFANERTFLAYLRTSLSLIISGVGLHEFFGSTFSMWIAIILIPLGLMVGGIGCKKYGEKRTFIKHRKDAYTPARQLMAMLKASKVRKIKLAH